MPKTGTIDHLIKLLDDDSEKVRDKIITELGNRIDELEGVLQNSSIQLSEQQRKYLEDVLAGNNHQDGGTRVAQKPGKDSAGQFFKIGQIVHHKHYNYRGVIVDFDKTCEANADWYLSNRTQPDKNQPWYHVLVHQSAQVTYAAHSSLEPSTDIQPVEHPFTQYFFEKYADGQYIRNDRPWPMDDE